jgi:hypothetical protein
MKSGIIVLATLVLFGIAACGFTSSSNADTSDAVVESETTFVFVKIPESIMPIERGDKYEDPLDEALKASSLGEVTGGGTQLDKPNPDGSASIAWVGIDVELSDIERGVPFLVATLKKLGAPKGSALEYRVGEKDIVVPVE